MKFRKLTANEIDCRVASVTKDGLLMLLLYKDARVDQNILDETFGIFGWQRKHEVIGGNLYCTVSVKDPESGEWISKQDVGVESNTEKEKGQASDSFKRACFNFGIGRELYTAPQIRIGKNNYNPNGKGSTYDRFSVKEIGYDDDGNINKLVIENKKLKKVVYTLGDDVEPEAYPSRNIMLTIVEKHYPKGTEYFDKLCKNWNISALEEMTNEQLIAVYNRIGEK